MFWVRVCEYSKSYFEYMRVANLICEFIDDKVNMVLRLAPVTQISDEINSKDPLIMFNLINQNIA